MMTTTNRIPAIPKKLRSGDWGALAQSESVRVGTQLAVTTRSGKSWTATVSKVIWAGKGVTICATESRPSSRSAGGRSRSRGTWTGCSCGSVEEYERAGDCWTCRHDR